jgi:CHAT domain-containing protein
MLAKQSITVTPITGADDRERFVSAARGATIVHFCGHGHYSERMLAETGLLFAQGLLRPGEIPSFERAAPIVFANACQASVPHSAETLGRAWSGLAAAFIEAGALNYLGSLWPILDSGSRDLAERFYSLLVEGHSVGESLRQAKLQAFSEGDSTWAAVVLFGCPRNRLRAGTLDRH